MNRLCVYCGSSFGNRPIYVEAAKATGAAIVRRGYELVYGGGKVGLMGAIVRPVHRDLVVDDAAGRLLDRMAAYGPPTGAVKWQRAG